MLNQYPIWKYFALILALVLGILFALPNIYGDDESLQISAQRNAPVDVTLQSRVAEMLSVQGISPLGIELQPGRLLVRLNDSAEQLKAQSIVKSALKRQYTVALNLAPRTPDWLRNMGAIPMYLGLDLRGGVHFLLEVDMFAAVSQAEQRYVGDIRTTLREAKIRYISVTRDDDGVWVKFRKEAERAKAYEKIRDDFRSVDVAEIGEGQAGKGGDLRLRVRLTEAEQRQVKSFALQQNITTLRNRVNELGVAEPVIQQQGLNRVVVQLPGIQDTARAKETLGATATLTFRMVEKTMSDAEIAVQTGRIPPGTRLFFDRDDRPVLLNKRPIVTGEYITDAASGIEQQSGTPTVFITLDGRGASRMSAATGERVGKSMAVVFVETKAHATLADGKNPSIDCKQRRIGDGKTKLSCVEQRVINIAVIQSQLGKRFQITGLDSSEEARELSLLLRAGSLAAPMEFIEERTVGPSLGKENIEQGRLSVIVGMALVLVFMALYYKVFGLVANIALVVNLVLIVAILSMMQATLTLPGIAGIVLTVGMAVDANVLIFERIREELRAGNSPQNSIHAGYEKAFSTIADANITTLIAAIVLFSFGTGAVKGFAITLSIGIISSMFTAIVGTRAIINLIYGGRRISKLSI